MIATRLMGRDSEVKGAIEPMLGWSVHKGHPFCLRKSAVEEGKGPSQK